MIITPIVRYRRVERLLAVTGDVSGNHACGHLNSVFANRALSWIHAIASFVLAIVDVAPCLLPRTETIDQNVVAAKKLDLKPDK